MAPAPASHNPAHDYYYYSVLGLPPLHHTTVKPVDPETLRRAYKAALLNAHPDSTRRSQSVHNGAKATGSSSQGAGFTVDEVKEAYSRLRDGDIGARGGTRMRNADKRAGPPAAEIHREALELVDLDDFSVAFVARMNPAASSSCEPLAPPASPRKAGNGAACSPAETSSEATIYTHPCGRCGAAQGFALREEDLETAAQRGDGEVVVGCGGCSLWVRVGFGVVEGEEEEEEEEDEAEGEKE